MLVASNYYQIGEANLSGSGQMITLVKLLRISTADSSTNLLVKRPSLFGQTNVSGSVSLNFRDFH